MRKEIPVASSGYQTMERSLVLISIRDGKAIAQLPEKL
jgi:hypothetical protein